MLGWWCTYITRNVYIKARYCNLVISNSMLAEKVDQLGSYMAYNKEGTNLIGQIDAQ